MTQHREETDHEEAPLDALRGFDLGVAPQRDLWPGIEARLGRRRRVGVDGWMSLAAAACVVAIVGLAVLRVPAPPAPTATPLAMPRTAFVEPDLRAVLGSRALVKANLQLARHSETQIRRALEQDPDSDSLRRLLRTTQNRSDELHRMLAAQAT